MDNVIINKDDFKLVTVKEIADNIQYGYTESSNKEVVGPKFLRITDIQENKVNWDNVPYCRIANDELKKYQLKDGDLVFARTGATVGKSFLIKGIFPEAVFASYLIRLRFPKSILDKYVYYFFQSHLYWRQIVEGQVGIGQPNVNGTKLGMLKIPITSYDKQQKIVSKIEELFSELDKGIESLKKAQEQLKVYRQAVLKWAFEGKLTNENVKDGELPEGWKKSTIGEISSSVEYGSSNKSKEKGKVPVLRMGNIQNGRFDWSDLVYTDDELEISKYLLNKNDVLFNRTNSAELVGKTAIFKGERIAIFAGYLIRINYDKSAVIPGYLNYYLNSHSARSYGNQVKTFGVNQSNINGTKLKTYPIAVCSLEEQFKVVQEIEARISVCDKIEETINKSLKQSEALRQSILKKAFEGKL